MSQRHCLDGFAYYGDLHGVFYYGGGFVVVRRWEDANVLFAEGVFVEFFDAVGIEEEFSQFVRSHGYDSSSFQNGVSVASAGNIGG